MKICYVANHNSGGNDDEGAIRYALEKLGHLVISVPERSASFRGTSGSDFLLFHKWDNVNALHRISVPKVFWYFDLVDWDDPSLVTRNRTRISWMKSIAPHVDLGFCTDGDWVCRFNPECGGKLVHLTQGADERAVGITTGEKRVPILFTGISNRGGRGRTDFVHWMRENYEEKFVHIERGTHRGALRTLIGESNVVVCPDHPVTDLYWSNRVYNAAGFGATILHPHCEVLTGQYRHNEEIVYYTDRENLRSKIDYLLRGDDYVSEFRHVLGQRALIRTQTEHLYRHRCESMLRTIKERLGVG